MTAVLAVGRRTTCSRIGSFSDPSRRTTRAHWRGRFPGVGTKCIRSVAKGQKPRPIGRADFLVWARSACVPWPLEGQISCCGQEVRTLHAQMANIDGGREICVLPRKIPCTLDPEIHTRGQLTLTFGAHWARNGPFPGGLVNSLAQWALESP